MIYEDGWEAGDFVQARFPISLNFPVSDFRSFHDARDAVKLEYRDSTRWKRMRCRNVRVLSETEAGTVYELRVGHSIEFDWTWEGAVALRPVAIDEFATNIDGFDKEAPGVAEIDHSIVWSGEILEVDEDKSRIFVVVSNPEHPPIRGSFFVRPFEFLKSLHSIYNDPANELLQQRIAERLIATEGSIHPEISSAATSGLPHLQAWWKKSWCVLWGPPGTGKTFTIGQQVASALSDPSERILVVSTTNRATDASAIAIGNAASTLARNELATGKLVRVGKGASLQRFRRESLASMLRGTETECLEEFERLAIELKNSGRPEDKALVRKSIMELTVQMADRSGRLFLDAGTRVVVSTAFRAISFLQSQEVQECISEGFAPFTTIFVDEAGLISRVSLAALTLLASRRVVQVGDSKQLAPISRISRILVTNQMKWLACSGLSHLDSLHPAQTGVRVLTEQYRMHPDVCKVVSAYQYHDSLVTAKKVEDRIYSLPKVLLDQPRTIWYVLDEDNEDFASIRAERGPGNRSWMRLESRRILERLFEDPSMRSASGMFVTPFKAQAKMVSTYFAKEQISTWTASTVHSQQGSEADIVIFDSVNAGSYNWPDDEWRRIVNVAISRSREVVIVLASRAEMNEPYLQPLKKHLSPKVLRRHGRKLKWEDVSAQAVYRSPNPSLSQDPSSLGNQLAKRKELRPVLSHEQERLCNLELDGKPRLVRGVAGSGKTMVMATWLTKTVKRMENQKDVRIWTVFANSALKSLLRDSIESAWSQVEAVTPFPWHRTSLVHIQEILSELFSEAGLSNEAFRYDYDAASAAYLTNSPSESILPRCDAMFIDEAQDLGPNTLKLLAALVRKTNIDEHNSRSINIFYDNAQNIYGRGVPTWSEFGLDMRGRSTVMKESFRSTQPITEFALNVLYRLQPPENSPELRELVARGLVEHSKIGGQDWWKVRFNQIDGPKPSFHQYASIEAEIDAIGAYCQKLIEVDKVQPSDIALLYNGKDIVKRIEDQLAPRLRKINVELSVQTQKPFERSSGILLVTTPHSFKGYDAEVVIIPAVEGYVAKGIGILASNLYVAMTRARSMLALFGQKLDGETEQKIYQTLEDCLDQISDRPLVESEPSQLDDRVDLLAIIGEQHRKWLERLWQQFEVFQEPILSESHEILAEPLFWLKSGKRIFAWFAEETISQRIRHRLEDSGITMLGLGQTPE